MTVSNSAPPHAQRVRYFFAEKEAVKPTEGISARGAWLAWAPGSLFLPPFLCFHLDVFPKISPSRIVFRSVNGA